MKRSIRHNALLKSASSSNTLNLSEVKHPFVIGMDGWVFSFLTVLHWLNMRPET
jgi:hypothetical protein